MKRIYRIAQILRGNNFSDFRGFEKSTNIFATKKLTKNINNESHMCRAALHLMALYRYFKVEKGGLPNPHGPLAKTFPSSSIASEFKLLGSLHSDRKKERIILPSMRLDRRH